MSPAARRVRDLALGLVVVASVIDIAPNWLIPGLGAVESVVAAPLRAAGLWQGNFRLFAPDADRTNEWLEVEVVWADGTTSVWQSWDWRARGFVERIARGHAQKYVEQVANPRAVLLHRGLARWAQRTLTPPSGVRQTAASVRIVRHYWVAPPPGPQRDAMRQRLGALPPPRDQYALTQPLYSRPKRPRAAEMP